MILDAAGPDADRIASTLDQVRRLVSERSVFGGQVIAIETWLEPKLGGQVPVTFLGRRDLGRSEVILPDGVLDAIERQVPGVARHAGRLRATGPPRHWQCRPTVGALR